MRSKIISREFESGHKELKISNEQFKHEETDTNKEMTDTTRSLRLL